MAGRDSGRLGRPPPTWVAVPKAGGVRWLVCLDPADDAEYATAVARAVPAVERALSPPVLANRSVWTGAATHVGDPPRGVTLEPWTRARARFRRLAVSLVRAPWVRALAVADVEDCYGSIRPATVASALAAAGCRGGDVEAVTDVLRGLALRGVPGLPVGPVASGVLANAVLSPVDRALRAAGLPHLRWVDDILVAAPSRGRAGAALRCVERALEGLGLRLNLAKTRIVTEPEEARRLAGGARGSPVAWPLT